MQVLKFGGTSVANAGMMTRVVDIVKKTLKKDRTILVCSAISKCTDGLIEIGNLAAAKDAAYKSKIDALQLRHNELIAELIGESYRPEITTKCNALFDSLRGIAKGVFLLGELSPASLDAIQSFGELLSTQIIARKFEQEGIDVRWVDSRQVIKTHSTGSVNAVDIPETAANMRSLMERNTTTDLIVAPGFIASDAQGRTTTLGRGGSDYTASLFAVYCGASVVEIWTDVPGIMTSNPKIVPTARTIERISYRAALELSHFGAKVIYPPTIQPVVAESIPILVKNTFDSENPGTLIEENPPHDSSRKLIGIANSDNIALISLEGSGMVGIPGFSSRLFGALSNAGINIILITQASSVHTMCIAVAGADAAKAKAAADECFEYEISLGKLNPLKVEKGYSIVCLVGNDVIGHSGATGRMLSSLGHHGIAVRATAQGSSERNISVIVRSEDSNYALRCIHEEFFDRSPLRTVNVYIAGYGTVGKDLIRMIRDGREAIAEHTGRDIRVCGVSNRRTYILDTNGIDLEKLPELLPAGKSSADGAFIDDICQYQLQHSVFVDCTGSSDIPKRYRELFSAGYHVVASNKIGFTIPYDEYKSMKTAALAERKTLRYETTVGAALPLLGTISQIKNSGDVIRRMDAVLSGTLNYILSTYDGTCSFADVVLKAQALGYTEPDPRTDLSGKDVLRKLVILSREAGIPLEESDVKVTAMLDVDEAQFAQHYREVTARGNRLRYVATLTYDESMPKCYRAEMGIKEVEPGNPLYNIMGTDNAAILHTDYYPSPLVIQGAGAGPAQTASGVLNDILK